MSTRIRAQATIGFAMAMGVGACGYKEPGQGATTDEDGTVIAGDGGAECAGSAPVLVAGPFCTYMGLGSAEPGLDEVPVLRISGAFHDDDGDLHLRSTRIWYDGEPLGGVDYETAQVKERAYASSGETPCESLDVDDMGDKIYLQPSATEYGVEMDWALSASDADGLWSEPVIVTCKTPLEDGSEP